MHWRGIEPSFSGKGPPTGLINDGVLYSLEPRNLMSTNHTDRSCTYESDSRPTAAPINGVIRSEFKNVIHKRRSIFLILQKRPCPACVIIHEYPCSFSHYCGINDLPSVSSAPRQMIGREA